MNGDGESSSALAKGGWRLKDDRAILSTHLLSLSLASAEGRSRGRSCLLCHSWLLMQY